MCEYKKGKWYGWNNEGECPVRSTTPVEVVIDDTNWGGGKVRKEKGFAGDFCWFDTDTPLVAFRVVEGKPREVVIEGVLYREVFDNA
jgi:hypothetical protein